MNEREINFQWPHEKWRECSIRNLSDMMLIQSNSYKDAPYVPWANSSYFDQEQVNWAMNLLAPIMDTEHRHGKEQLVTVKVWKRYDERG